MICTSFDIQLSSYLINNHIVMEQDIILVTHNSINICNNDTHIFFPPSCVTSYLRKIARLNDDVPNYYNN